VHHEIAELFACKASILNKFLHLAIYSLVERDGVAVGNEIFKPS
jgi:hypothetical protein